MSDEVKKERAVRLKVYPMPPAFPVLFGLDNVMKDCANPRPRASLRVRVSGSASGSARRGDAEKPGSNETDRQSRGSIG